MSLLGTGSSSRVYLVEHLKLKSLRAVKCVAKVSCRQGLLLSEASLLKSLKHQAIPLIYDVKEDDTYIYIIEEYIQGESLQNFVLNQSNISFSLLISIGIQLCSLFDYLHQQPAPILYLDLKPEHILLCGNQIKLIDFGTSSRVNSTGNVQQAYASYGFSAPEQRFLQNCNVQTDVYAIGAILYFMQTKEILTFSVFDFFSPKKYCSRTLRHIIQKAAAPIPTLRYKSTRQLGGALQKMFDAQRHGIPNAHLLQRVAVIGSQSRVGTTHFAISFVCWLNAQNHSAVYEEKNQKNVVRQLVRHKQGFASRNGFYCYGDFKTILPEEASNSVQASSNFMITDYGTSLQDLPSLADCSLFILLTGSKPWELAETRLAVQQASHFSPLKIVCNYQSSTAAKHYTQLFEQKLYCFPLDENPFAPTPAKDEFFQLLLS
ncbi:MAG: serine/threonine-protein kinase [Lachnospiraceae bacterium]